MWPQGWPQDYEFRFIKEGFRDGEWIVCRIARLTEANAAGLAHELTDGGGNPVHRATDGVALLVGATIGEAHRAQLGQLLGTLLPAIRKEQQRRSRQSSSSPLGFVLCLTKCDLYPDFLRDPWAFGDHLKRPGSLAEFLGESAAYQLESLLNDHVVARPIYSTSAVGFLVDHETQSPLKHHGSFVPQLGPDGLLHPERIEPAGFDMPVRRLLEPIGAALSKPRPETRPSPIPEAPARLKRAAKGVWYANAGMALVAAAGMAAVWGSTRRGAEKEVTFPSACPRGGPTSWVEMGSELEPRELSQIYQGFLAEDGKQKQHVLLKLEEAQAAGEETIEFRFRSESGTPVVPVPGTARFSYRGCSLSVPQVGDFRLVRLRDGRLALSAVGSLRGTLQPARTP